jgi:hypothetical protein
MGLVEVMLSKGANVNAQGGEYDKATADISSQRPQTGG